MNSNEKNNALIIKNSWILANMCASLKDYSIIDINQLKKLLQLICVYCDNSKEKIKSNAYRALGYYIKNISSEEIDSIFKTNGQELNENIIKIKHVYDKDFSTFSVKVSFYIDYSDYVYYV